MGVYQQPFLVHYRATVGLYRVHSCSLQAFQTLCTRKPMWRSTSTIGYILVCCRLLRPCVRRGLCDGAPVRHRAGRDGNQPDPGDAPKPVLGAGDHGGPKARGAAAQLHPRSRSHQVHQVPQASLLFSPDAGNNERSACRPPSFLSHSLRRRCTGNGEEIKILPRCQRLLDVTSLSPLIWLTSEALLLPAQGCNLDRHSLTLTSFILNDSRIEFLIVLYQ